MNKPLAFRMRPDSLDEVIGQEKLKAFLLHLKDSGSMMSLVFYGPPGTGKTTLAKAFSGTLGYHSIFLNAVMDNKAKMESAFEEAVRFTPTIVIIDEIHRMDKGKQDILLPRLENGDFFMIGCTTANPFLSLNPAIRSRCRLLETMPLTKDEILIALNRAISSPKGLDYTRKFTPESLEYLASVSGGDLRFAYNQLEAIALSFGKEHVIQKSEAEDIVRIPNFLSDLNEDEHYDTVSAFQKSIRGSQIDAAVYYLAKLLKSGDLEGVIRRLLVTAYEDIGLANPQAVDRCYHACQVAREVGLPEAQIPLAFTVVELAGSPKSKSSCLAIETASAKVDERPLHVKDYLRLTRAVKDEGEAYPYDDPDVWPILEYLPDELVGTKFYNPEDNKFENAMKEYWRIHGRRRTSDMKEAKRRAHLK